MVKKEFFERVSHKSASINNNIIMPWSLEKTSLIVALGVYTIDIFRDRSSVYSALNNS